MVGFEIDLYKLIWLSADAMVGGFCEKMSSRWTGLVRHLGENAPQSDLPWRSEFPGVFAKFLRVPSRWRLNQIKVTGLGSLNSVKHCGGVSDRAADHKFDVLNAR